MRTPQSPVRETSGNRKLAPMDDDPAVIAKQLGYYDPDSAAYDEADAVPVTAWVDSTDEGLPVRELVTA